MMDKSFCLLTPPGRSAVATTLVRADDIVAQLASHFVTASSKPAKLIPLRPAFGFWKNDRKANEGLVVCLLDDNSAEIHSHGGSIAPRMIARALQDTGFDEITPSQLAVESISSWAAETQTALIHAPTQKTAKRLLRIHQLTPGKLKALRAKLTTSPCEFKREIETALEFALFGMHLVQPWKIVICGQPNVGKSSLINVLSGFSRVLVHDTPGTTRDTISQYTAVEGWPVELTDTAGIRNTDDEIEKKGVERAIAESQLADLRIALFDSSQHWSETDGKLLELVKADLIVHNKCDQRIEDPNRPEGLFISAVHSTGIKPLLRAITNALVPVIPPKDQWLPVNTIQQNRLKEIQTLLGTNAPAAFEKVVDLLG